MKKELNDVNQHLKTFNNEYIFLTGNVTNAITLPAFLVTDSDSAFSVVYYSSAVNEIQGDNELFDKSFKISDAKEFFQFLRSSKELFYEPSTQLMSNDKAETFKIHVLTPNDIRKELKGNFGYIIDNLSTVKVSDKFIEGINSNLLVSGIEIDTLLTSNNIVDALKKNIKKLSDHTLCFAEVEENSLSVFPEFSHLDLSKKIFIFPSKVFRKLKILKKDVLYFDVYIRSNKVLIKYGINDKEDFNIIFNILYDIAH